MSKILVLAEKPSVGKELGKVLGCNKVNNGYLEGNKYIVTWALGHLVTLADPEVYDNKYKIWSLETLPMLPKKMELVVIKQGGKQFSIVKNLMKREDVTSLIIATDAGREGELVARWIMEKANFRKPFKRLWISSQTEKAIKDGFNNLKDGRAYDNLYKAAQCRAEADWLVGLNVTRALTSKFNAQLSAGRVQTPTLYMIVKREEEIKKFKPVDYYSIDVKTKGFNLSYVDKNNNNRIFDKKKADIVANDFKNGTITISEVKSENKKELPPLAYDLTELQRDANRRYGYSAKQTLQLMQRLYENHKLLTYPRTDSRYLTSDMVSTLNDRLKAVNVGPYSEAVRKILRGKINTTKRLVDNSKVSDHHAIIPTEQHVNLSTLSFEERNIYDLVVKRFLEVLSPAFEYEQITVKGECNNHIVRAKGKVVKSLGWKEISGNVVNDKEDEDEKEQNLPSINTGDKLKVEGVSLRTLQTKPPARYTEATLLSAMENPQKFMEDNKALKEAINEAGGLGTPATRADIIEKLFSTFYVERKGKEIHPTSKGIQLIDLAPEDLKSPKLTAKWEQTLNLISKGSANPKDFAEEMRRYSAELVKTVAGSSTKYVHDNMTREKCPDCGKYLLEVNGKKGKMLVCQDRACGYRKGIARVTNSRCPECHKKLELRGQGEKQIFVCPNCNYREKMSEFKNRKQESNKKVTKQEVNKYLRKQQKENNEPINSALADALSKLKF